MMSEYLEKITPEKLKQIMIKDESYSVINNNFEELKSFINSEVLN